MLCNYCDEELKNSAVEWKVIDWLLADIQVVFKEWYFVLIIGVLSNILKMCVAQTNRSLFFAHTTVWGDTSGQRDQKSSRGESITKLTEAQPSSTHGFQLPWWSQPQVAKRGNELCEVLQKAEFMHVRGSSGPGQEGDRPSSAWSSVTWEHRTLTGLTH